MSLLSHTHDCCPPAASVTMRGAQSDCIESSCKPTENSARGWNAQHAVARSAGHAAAKKSETSFATRGRSASL